MSENLPDKYPTDSSRRRFVRGVVASAALAGVGTAGAAVVDSTTQQPGLGGGPTTYRAAERVGGPAPRGLPQIPVELDDDGVLYGIWPEVEEIEEGGRIRQIAEMELGGDTYQTTWFQYCGIQSAPGVEPDADQDNAFKYASTTNYDWQSEQVQGGDNVNVTDFEDYEDFAHPIGSGGLGKGAQAQWRSEGLERHNIMPVQVIRSPLVEEAAQDDEWLSATTAQGFIAFLTQCTHFCCVPGWKTYQDSPQFDAENRIYCQCHQSVFDPFNIVTQTFFALPRPDE